MEENKPNLDFFVKIKKARELIESNFPDVVGDTLMTWLCHIGHYHYDKKKRMLSERELVLYDLLLRNGYNPSTVYKWFLITKVPEDILGRIRRQEISQKQALRMACNRRHLKEVNLGLQLMEAARAVIRTL